MQPVAPPAAAGTLSSAKTRGPPAKTVLAVARPLPPAAPLCRMRGQTKQRRASRRPTIRAQPVRRRPVPGLVKSKSKVSQFGARTATLEPVNDEIAAAIGSPVGAGAWGTA